MVRWLLCKIAYNEGYNHCRDYPLQFILDIGNISICFKKQEIKTKKQDAKGIEKHIPFNVGLNFQTTSVFII
jgi:hypothetical protein